MESWAALREIVHQKWYHLLNCLKKLLVSKYRRRLTKKSQKRSLTKLTVLRGSLTYGLARLLIRCERVIYLCQLPVFDASVKCDEQIENVIMYNYQGVVVAVSNNIPAE